MVFKVDKSVLLMLHREGKLLLSKTEKFVILRPIFIVIFLALVQGLAVAVHN